MKRFGAAPVTVVLTMTSIGAPRLWQSPMPSVM
jgi:hypothetical protein